MSSHSHAPASSAARRIQCPQSVTWELMSPDTGDDSDARDGEAAHWAAAELIAGRPIDIGQIAPNGVVLTHEMCLGADVMFNDVAKRLREFGLAPSQGQCEQRVAIPRVGPGHFGTPDYRILVERPGQPFLLLLWDFKFGHRPVEVFENPQLIDYIAGCCEGIHDLYPGVDVEAAIVQPRSFHRDGPVRRWKTKLSDLRVHINISAGAYAEAFDHAPRTRVGPECRDCKARLKCTALQRAGLAAMDQAESTTPHDITPAEAGRELQMLERAEQLIQARKAGLEAMVEQALRRGEPVAGWMLAAGESREKWTVPAEQVIAMGKAMRLGLGKPIEAITPRQARDAGLDPAIVAQISTRPPAGLKLIKDDGSAARKAFGS